MTVKSLEKNNFVCQCYLTENYYVNQIGEHVSFKGRNEFLKTYSRTLEQRTAEEIEDILTDLENEHCRRQNQGHVCRERKKEISKKYIPLHRHVYQLQEKFLSPEFLSLMQICCSSSTQLSLNVDSVKDADRIYQIPIFTPTFCQHLKEEILNFEMADIPKSRPNTMNHYGVMLEEMLDLDEGLIKPLRENYLSPIAEILYPECTGKLLDSHKAFIVTYRMGEDLDLDYHYDNAEVTYNVSLDSSFEGGELYFGAMKLESSKSTRFSRCTHKVGYGVLHRGQHLHGVMPLESGERQNLIIWMRSSEVRNRVCPMCFSEPSLVETEGSGDGFTMKEVDVCAVA